MAEAGRQLRIQCHIGADAISIRCNRRRTWNPANPDTSGRRNRTGGTSSGISKSGSGNVVESCLALGETTMPNAMSSTAQDLARGKETEIGSLNGYVARRGAELGIETPVNHTLYNLIKLLEKSFANPAVN